jgi:integrase
MPSMTSPRLPSGALVVRVGPTGAPFYEAKWRYQGRQRLRRVGPAWLSPTGDGGWEPRRGRLPADHFDEKRATVRMAAMIEEDSIGIELAEAERQAVLDREVSFREVTVSWLEWLREVKGAKPSTLRDYESMLAEPGAPHRRGKGTCEGRIMKAFGDQAAKAITTSDISKFLRSLDRASISPRSVNKHRQVLSAIFNYATREDTFELPRNPVAGTDKRREPPASALDFFEPEEVEALAGAAAAGQHRRAAVGLGADEIAARCAEDAQDAEMFRVLAYTGMRLGEVLALQWGDVDLDGRRLIVQRAVSGREEGPTKAWQVRYVPLADQPHDALLRLQSRVDFTGRNDYVFGSRVGGRLDASAVRRRYHGARRAAGLRHVKLHGLRHGAGSLVARHTDAVFVQHFLGHSKMATTERYMHAKARREDVDRLNLAFGGSAARQDAESSAS